PPNASDTLSCAEPRHTSRTLGMRGGNLMPQTIDELVTMYDEKQISRRQLIGALLMASRTARLAADAGQEKPASPDLNLTRAPPPKNALFRGRLINHVTLSIRDI